jgi:hypothetical protein
MQGGGSTRFYAKKYTTCDFDGDEPVGRVASGPFLQIKIYFHILKPNLYFVSKHYYERFGISLEPFVQSFIVLVFGLVYMWSFFNSFSIL